MSWVWQPCLFANTHVDSSKTPWLQMPMASNEIFCRDFSPRVWRDENNDNNSSLGNKHRNMKDPINANGTWLHHHKSFSEIFS